MRGPARQLTNTTDGDVFQIGNESTLGRNGFIYNENPGSTSLHKLLVILYVSLQMYNTVIVVSCSTMHTFQATGGRGVCKH